MVRADAPPGTPRVVGYRDWSNAQLIVAHVVVTLAGCAIAVAIELAGAPEWLLFPVVIVAVAIVTPLVLELMRRGKKKPGA